MANAVNLRRFPFESVAPRGKREDEKQHEKREKTMTREKLSFQLIFCLRIEWEQTQKKEL